MVMRKDHKNTENDGRIGTIVNAREEIMSIVFLYMPYRLNRKQCKLEQCGRM